MPLVRLNKYLADRGVASRRKCDELIASGTVLVDGEPVSALGTKIDPETARVEVDGRVYEPDKPTPLNYYLLNKPKRVICTNDRHEERKRAVDLITDPGKGRVYTVGRLDEDSTGLILLTNDGDFANLIAHPRHEVPKTYLVKVRGRIEGDAIEKLKRGVFLAEGKTSPIRVRVYKRSSNFSSLSVTLAEGKNREVRRIFAKVGFNVVDLRRTRIGNLSDQRLKEGQWRPLMRAEVKDLIAVAQGEKEVYEERSSERSSDRPRRAPARSSRNTRASGARLSGKPSPDQRHPSARPKDPRTQAGKKTNKKRRSTKGVNR